VGQIEPGRAVVVEVGQSAFFQQGRARLVPGHQSRVANQTDFGGRVHRRGIDVAVPRSTDGAGKFQNLLAGPLRRIQPAPPELVELLGRRGDGGFLPRRGRRERKGLEAGGRGVAGPRLQPGAKL